MHLPTDSDYFEAIQHPLRCFRDNTLRRGQAVLDPQGKPLVRHGRYAEVYEVRTAGGHECWAVKCYTRALAGIKLRYQALHEHLLGIDCPGIVQAEWLNQGISIRGRWFPAVKMRWVEGQRLNDYVREVCDQPQTLLELADLWKELASQLRRVGLAHGNLQHDHVLVGRSPTGTLRLHLIDYDGVFVPSLGDLASEKAGHANYQHPQRLWQKTCDAQVDRFPQLVIYTVLRALAVRGPALLERFDQGDNLIFREFDFQDPGLSAAFRVLWQVSDPVVHALTSRLLLACQQAPGETPLLEEVADGQPLSAEEIKQIEAIVESSAATETESFCLAIDDPPASTSHEPAAPTAHDLGSLDLEIEDELIPVVAVSENAPPLPCPPAPVATAIYDKAACPQGMIPVLVEAPPQPAVDALQGPHVAVYHLEAWMPEQIAVIKMQGFVRAEEAEVVDSVPGLVRVHLLDRYSMAPETPSPSLLTWLGLVQPPCQGPKHLATLEMHMKHKDTEHNRLLDITVRIGPGPDTEPDDPAWRPFCDRLFCSLRGFLMGNA
jgi:hypothetical protein